MNDLKSRFGLLRSELIYFWKPFTRRRLRRFYRQFVQPGGLCFDIGAHLGSRSRAFLDLGARVVALEPQPHCAAYLRKRWGGERRFTLIAKAVGAQPGLASLHINRLNPTISTLSPAGWRRAMAAAAATPERWDHRVEVEVTTLDRLIEEYGCARISARSMWKDLKRRPLPVCPIQYRRFRSNSSASKRTGRWHASGG